MNQSQQIRIKILKIALDIKFPCAVYLESKGVQIANSSKYEKGCFTFNNHAQTLFNCNNINYIWECAVTLKSTRGANYNLGKIILNFNDELVYQNKKVIQCPIQNCYDRSAKAEIMINCNTNRIVHTFSQSTINRLSDNQASVVDFDSNRYHNETDQINDADSSMTDKMGPTTEIEILNLKNKFEKKNKTISEKSSKYKQGKSGKQNSDKESLYFRESMLDLQRENEEKSYIISQLQREITKLQIQLNDANHEISEQKKIQSDLISLHHQQMNCIKQEVMKANDSQINDLNLNKQIQQFKCENENYKKQKSEMENKMKNMNKLLEENEAKLKKLTNEIEIKNEQKNEMEKKIKDMEYGRKILTQEKQDAARKLKEARKQIEDLRQFRKNYKMLENELSILRRNSSEAIGDRDTLLNKLNQDSKRRIQNLLAQIDKAKGEFNEILNKYNDLRRDIQTLNEKNQLLEAKNKEISNKFEGFNKTISKMKEKQSQYQSTIKQLHQSNEQSSIKTVQLEEQLNSLKQQNSKLKQENQIKQIMVNKFKQDNDELKYQVEKYEIEQAISSQQAYNTHFQCREKQQTLFAQLKGSDEKISNLTANLMETRTLFEESQRFLQQVRQQQANVREINSINNQKLQNVHNKITKLEKQLTEKQFSNNLLKQQISKLQQFNKEKQLQIINLTAKNLELQSKSTKDKASYQIMEAKLAELEIDVKRKATEIDTLQHTQLQLTNQIKNEKQKNIQYENQFRILKLQYENKMNKIKTNISQVIQIPLGQNPIEVLIRHHKQTISQLTTGKNKLLKELHQINEENNDKNRQIQFLQQQVFKNQGELQKQYSTIEQLNKCISYKDTQIESIRQQHDQLISIHQQYIFSFNRYKVDKEQQIRILKDQVIKIQIKLGEEINQRENVTHNKIQEINHNKERIFQMEIKIKEIEKQLEKSNNKVQELEILLKSESTKNGKLSNDLQMGRQQNNKLLIQNQSMNVEINELNRQLKNHNQMITLLTKSKDKIIRENTLKIEKLHELETLNNSLTIKNQELDALNISLNEQSIKLQESVKFSKMKEKDLEEERNLLRESKMKSDMKVKEKQIQIKQLQQKINEIQVDKIRKSDNWQKDFKEMQKKIEWLEIELAGQKKENKELLSELQTSKQNNQKLFIISQQKNVLQTNYEKLTKQNESSQEIIQQLNEETRRLREKISQLSDKCCNMQGQLCQKQQALFVSTGKINQIEVNWQAEQRKMKQKYIESQQQFHNELQQTKNMYERQINQLQNSILKLEESEKTNQVFLKVRQSQIQNLKNQVKDANEFIEQRAKIFETQFEKLNESMKQKLEKARQQLKEEQQKQMQTLVRKSEAQQQCMKLKMEIDDLKQANSKISFQLQIANGQIQKIQAINESLKKKWIEIASSQNQTFAILENDVLRQVQILRKKLEPPLEKSRIESEILSLKNEIVRVFSFKNNQPF